DLITVECSITEITIEDKYEITLNTTFETDVPAAVVVLEPSSTTLPDMAVGDVFQSELRLTNYGLIRADELQFTPPSEDGYYRFEFLANLPDTLSANESLVIPYRVTALTPFEADGAGSGGDTCSVYEKGTRIEYKYVCKNGVTTRGSTIHDWMKEIVIGQGCDEPGEEGDEAGTGGSRRQFYPTPMGSGPSGSGGLPEVTCIDCPKCRNKCCDKPCPPNTIPIPNGGPDCPSPPQCKPINQAGGGDGFGG
ncbi:MAG: hypothetical protein AB2535_17560, partial [Candidatus Thiodiazotropha endolucinida]